MSENDGELLGRMQSSSSTQGALELGLLPQLRLSSRDPGSVPLGLGLFSRAWRNVGMAAGAASENSGDDSNRYVYFMVKRNDVRAMPMMGAFESPVQNR